MAGHRLRAPPLVAALLAVLLLMAGCLSLTAARVPQGLLQGSDGNGWSFNATQSDGRAHSQDLGLVSYQSLVYTDPGNQGGYPASLTVTTLQTILSPSAQDLRTRIQDQVRSRAEAQGINVSDRVASGQRQLAQGYRSLWFVFEGNVTGNQPFYTTGAHVKILGEVWTCGSSRTSVAVVGLAQTSDVRYVAGSPVATRTDDTNWREIVADPQGTIGGVRGSNGLAFHVMC